MCWVTATADEWCSPAGLCASCRGLVAGHLLLGTFFVRTLCAKRNVRPPVAAARRAMTATPATRAHALWCTHRAVLFVRYVIATFMSPFWPDQCTELGISAELNGLIMASYPLGIAITSVVAPVAILRYGTKTVSTYADFEAGTSPTHTRCKGQRRSRERA